MTLEEALLLPDGLHENIDEDLYHQIPYFSASYAKSLIINPALAQEERKASKSMDIGHAVHALVLEGRKMFDKRFLYLPETAPSRPTEYQRNAKKPSIETVTAIQWWDLFEKNCKGRLVLSNTEKEVIEGANQAIFDYPCVVKRGMFKEGMKEVTIIYTDYQTGIRCKSRLDCLNGDTIDDLKTTKDASSFGFRREIRKYGYRLQCGAYSIAAQSVGITINTVRLCAVQTTSPFPVITGEFSEEAIERGQLDYMKALNIEAECRQLGFYPNFYLPGHLNSLLDVYALDGSVKNDNDLYEIFDVENWEV